MTESATSSAGSEVSVQEHESMKRTYFTVALSIVALACGSLFALAQAPGPQPHPMSFFVTGAGMGKGGDLGGLAGADAHCQQLAAAVGAGNKTWRAYLSTQARPGQPAANARDRVGSGPWHNQQRVPIAQNIGDLHGDTLEQARLGSNLFKETALDEHGNKINGVMEAPNTQHDMLTGSQLDGRAFTDNMDHTCNNWTSSGQGSAQLGHSDRMGGGGTSWNSAHASRGCSQQDLVATGGAGRFYCFAIN
jgi:hypothetical protein